MCDQQFTQLYKKFSLPETMNNSTSRIHVSSSSHKPKQSRPSRSETCLKFTRGKCNYGANCIFAHNFNRDVRKLLRINKDDILTAEERRKIVTRLKPCWWYISGKECPFGDKCRFLHQSGKSVKGGLGASREDAAVTVVSNVPAGEYRRGNMRFENLGSDARKMQQNNVLWKKTRPCYRWAKAGSCPYGPKCCLAHGEEELRKLGFLPSLEPGRAFTVDNLAIATKDAESSNEGIRAAYEQQKKWKKYLIQCNDIEKMSRIYADWIDSVPLVGVASG